MSGGDDFKVVFHTYFLSVGVLLFRDVSFEKCS
jgi:hypothetical protein